MSAPHIPAVEDRLLDTEQALAMLLKVARAMSSAEDTMLSQKDEAAAWEGFARLANKALADVRAANHALTVAQVNPPAPDVDPEA